MKKRIRILMLFWLYVIIVLAQSPNHNYIVSNTYTMADNATALTNIQYHDELGREIQTVLKNYSSVNAYDIVTQIQYDAVGRDSVTWLPIVSSGNGDFVPANIFNGANSTKNTLYLGDQYAYNQVDYLPSPINRITRKYGAGTDWRSGQEKYVSYIYQANLENEVAQFTADGNGNLTRLGFYPPNTLYKVIIEDEDNNKTTEFKDQLGRVIMSQAFNGDIQHNTHYVYNILNQLCFIITPEAADVLETLNGSASPQENSTSRHDRALYELCYCYRYDDRENCIEKQLPGCEPVCMVYDKANRLILSQDGNQRIANQWSFYKYDLFGREIQSGNTTIEANSNGYSHNDMISQYENILVVESKAISGDNSIYTNNHPLGNQQVATIENFYDDYSFINLPFYSTQSSYLQYKDKFTDSELSLFDVKYTTNVGNIATQGMKTGHIVRDADAASMNNNAQYVITAIYYDENGRVVQTRSNNRLGGYDYDFYHYNFLGNILNHRHVHKSSYLTSPLTEDYEFNYDHAQRLITTTHKINTQRVITLSTNSYDELGRLKTKSINGGSEIIYYTYNIRSWLKSISSPHFSQTLFYQDAPNGKPVCYNGNISAVQWGQGNVKDKKYFFNYDDLNRLKKAQYVPDELFNEEITHYDKNGNILGLKRNGYINDFETEWPVYPGPIDDIGFNYKGNQLKDAWEKLDDQDFFVVASNDFRDVVPENSIDRYRYDPNGNQSADFNKGIAWIKFNSLNLPRTIQFINGNKTEYLYDALGVKYKAQWGYAVNTQNIPLGAEGIENNSLGGISRTEYCGNYVYLNGILRRIITPEGYVETPGALPLTYIGFSSYKYLLKDHLGNTRRILSTAALSNTSTTLYANGSHTIDYYPFGMEVTRIYNPGGENYSPAFLASGVTPYLYNGKEIDRMHGVNWYDYGARLYDPALGRWQGVDPLAEKYYNISPYAYCLNNPVKFIDPDGRDVWEINNQGKIVNQIKDKNQDAFYLVDKNGNRTYTTDADGNKQYNYISFEYGTITDSKKSGWFRSATSFAVNSESSGAELFVFFADNTKIEYGLINTQNDGSTVMTNHNETSVSVSATAQKMNDKGQTVTSVIHNHPEPYSIAPSGFGPKDKSGDKFAARTYIPNAERFVYQNGKLVAYDGKVVISTPMSWGLVFRPSTARKIPIFPIRQYPGVGLPPP